MPKPEVKQKIDQTNANHENKVHESCLIKKSNIIKPEQRRKIFLLPIRVKFYSAFDLFK